MKSPVTPPLVAAATVPAPDVGPSHRGGPLAWFSLITCLLVGLGGALFLYQEDRLGWPLTAVIGFGALATVSLILVGRGRHSALPASHDILAGALGFELHCTCRDVAATVFLYPDHLARGGATQLLCFVENHASRQRIATFHVGPHTGLGLAARHTVRLHLAAGQAAVYALPLRAAATLAPGVHDLPVALRVEKPAGDGALLPGASHRLHNLWRVRFAAPFTLPGHSAHATATSSAPGPARYLSLGTAGAPAPDFTALENLLAS